jgi:hypothetical protein
MGAFTEFQAELADLQRTKTRLEKAVATQVRMNQELSDLRSKANWARIVGNAERLAKASGADAAIRERPHAAAIDILAPDVRQAKEEAEHRRQKRLEVRVAVRRAVAFGHISPMEGIRIEAEMNAREDVEASQPLAKAIGGRHGQTLPEIIKDGGWGALPAAPNQRRAA